MNGEILYGFALINANINIHNSPAEYRAFSLFTATQNLTADIVHQNDRPRRLSAIWQRRISDGGNLLDFESYKPISAKRLFFQSQLQKILAKADKIVTGKIFTGAASKPWCREE